MKKSLCVLTAALVLSVQAWAAAAEKFEIKAQSLTEALRLYADQTGEQIVFFSEIGKGVKCSEVTGSFTREQALERLLSKTGLTFERLNAKTIAITDSTRNTQTSSPTSFYRPPSVNPAEWMRVAQLGPDKQEGTAKTEADRNTTAVRPDEQGLLVVTGSRVPRTEVEGASPLITFDKEYIERSGFGTLEEFMRVLPQNFSASGSGRQTVPNDENPTLIARQAGQSGLGLRGLGSNNTLVLINGRRAPLSGIGNRGTPTQQSFFDINTIPIGLIERIEVLTDGASAVYGTDAIAGVVNIILKQNFNETDAKMRFAGTQHGGGFERGATFTHGFSIGRLQTTTTLDGFERKELLGSQRPFSASSDHRAQGGSDFRSNIGYPNTIFALPGQNLPGGLLNPDGTPARQAVIPANQDGRNLTIASFANTVGQQTAYDQSDLYSLVTPTRRYAASSRLNFAATGRLNLFGEVAYTYVDSSGLANPLITSNANGGTTLPRIPANNPYNPFGVVLGFRMTHAELGPRNIQAETESTRVVTGMQLDLGREWSLEASGMYYLQNLYSSNPAVDNTALQNALNQTDPALALNLFGDYGAVGPTNAPGIYESIIRNTIVQSDSAIYSGDFLVSGPLPVLRMPGGPIRTAFGGEWSHQNRLRTTNTPSTVEPARSRERRDDYAMYGELQVPFFSREHSRRFLRRLELQIATRWQEIEDSGTSIDPKYGLLWSPFESLMLRGSYGTGYRAPALSELERPESERSQSIIDRQRNNQAYPVTVISGSFPNLGPETSRTYGLGMVIQVPWIKGLSFSFDGYRKDQENLTASLTAQQMVDFEALFADRIVRNPPSAADQAAGRPGQIAEVDGRFSNFGQVVTEGWDFSGNYDLNTSELGRFTFRLMGTYLGSYKVAFNPGDPLVERRGSFGFPQKWKGNVSMIWGRDRWGGAIFCYYNGAAERSATDRLSTWTTIDVNASYNWSESLRFQGGISNLLDEEPPFANTIWGYDGGFHNPRMRAYSLSAAYRF